MRTDDQLVHDLGQAFRAATDDLAYHGRVPSPRPPGVLAVPVLAGVAGIVGVAVAVSGNAPGSRVQASASATASPRPAQIAPGTTAPRPPALQVTRTLRLAGYTFSYRQAASAQPLVGRFVDAVPAGADPVATAGPGKCFVGKDPTTGDETAWVENTGTVLAISAPDATRAELTTLVQGPPRPIAVVSGS